MKKPRIPNRDK